MENFAKKSSDLSTVTTHCILWCSARTQATQQQQQLVYSIDVSQMLPSNYCDPTPPTRAVPPTALVLRMDDVSVPFPYDREVHNISIVNDEAEGRNRDGLFSSSSAPSPHKLSSIDDTCTPCIKISPDSFCIGESDVTIGQQLMKNNSVAKERTIIERSFEAKEGGGSEPFAELTSTSFPFDHYGSPANSASFGTTQRGSITLCRQRLS